jgi:hypothetical protein
MVLWLASENSSCGYLACFCFAQRNNSPEDQAPSGTHRWASSHLDHRYPQRHQYLRSPANRSPYRRLEPH